MYQSIFALLYGRVTVSCSLFVVVFLLTTFSEHSCFADRPGSSKKRTATSTRRGSNQPARPLLAPFTKSVAENSQRAWASSMNLEVDNVNSIGMQLKLIPPGEFMMGAPVTEKEQQKNEVQHRVKISKPFYVGVYEVTQAEYQKIMGENPSWFSQNGKGKAKVAGINTDRFPVEFVNWHDANIFCRKLSEREGKKYRLPTEAEWEYTCRAGTTGPFHFGNLNNGRLSNADGRHPYLSDIKTPFLARTTKVGSYVPNAFGLYDYHGNVFEWCADWYDPQLYHRQKGRLTTNPLVSVKSPNVITRVLRGGSWFKGKVLHGRSAYRRGNLPSWKGQNIGFRVVQEADYNSKPVHVAQSRQSKQKKLVTIKDPRAGELVYIPAGAFKMGASAAERESRPSERPQHRVQIKKGFYIGKYETTFLQFRMFVAETRYKTDAEKNPRGASGYDASKQEIVNHDPQFSWRNTGFQQAGNLPVVNVSWNDAVAYCRWLSAKDGKYLFRLPTEAEREYVGRAGTVTAYGWGERPESMIGNENISDQSLAKKLSTKSFHKKRCGKGDDGYPFNAPVGSFQANAFGLYDIHGNVAEWCDDVYVEDRYLIPESKVPTQGEKRVLRGGSSMYWPIDCRVARRIGPPATERRCDRGFRVVREELPRPAKELAAVTPNPKPQPQPAAGPKIPVRELVTFQPVPMDEPVTSFTVSEDNRFLICSHQAANQVSIWDAVTKEKVAVLSTTAPRSLLSRGNQLFVANAGQGTVSVFEFNKKWSLKNQLEVEKPNIVHLSAAQGEHFQGELIVTCHGEGNQASYRDCHVYHLNAHTDKDRHVSKSAMATCSYDGKIVITQGSFNLSGAGGISGFIWTDFVTSKSAKPIYRAGVPRAAYAYQVYPGSYWMGNNYVSGGIPLVTMKSDLGNLLIADRSLRQIYSVTKDRIRVHRMNVELEEIADRKVQFPEGDFSRVYHDIYRIRDYHLDHPIGFTDRNQTHLFAIDMKKNLILSASTPAFHQLKSSPAKSQPGTLSATPGGSGSDIEKINFLPARIAEGELLSHSFPVKSGAEYQLVSGPEGLKQVKNKLVWKPRSDAVGIHELKIKIIQGDEVSFARVELEVIAREIIKYAGSLEAIERFSSLPLEADFFKLIPTNNYQSLLLLQGDLVKRLTGNGTEVSQTVRLPKRYRYLAERKGKFIALDDDLMQLDLIDQTRVKVSRSIPLKSAGLTIMEVTDFAAHPKLHISYVAVKVKGDLPRYRVLIIDELKGKVIAPTGFMGTWVRVDPAGRMLYTGYRDLYQRGSRFHINPGWRLVEIPDYGNIDFLICYNLRNGRPSLKQYHTNAGGHGTGIRLSPDGERITYLSNGGFPSLSRNLAGWSSANLKINPVIYETKDRAVTNLFAFHPTLKIVAVPGEKSVVIFDRESGKVLNGKLLLTASGLGGVKVDELMFSPDGTSLLLVCNEKFGGRYLRSVPLKLSSKERPRVSKAIKITEFRSLVAMYKQGVTKVELDSLGSAFKGEKQTPQEIARQFNQSVVLIKSDEGTGSGFVVGRNGFVLTCAHVVPEEGKVLVSFVSEKTDSKTKKESEAELVYIDEAQDLALLKLKGMHDLKTVTVDDQKSVEPGEQVTVIGNPSAGSTILSQTLTTGVVSNPVRILRGQPHVQISAAVNPGNSGGPVFDDHGNVIGLVVLKADIEAAGFAVPSTQLREFLETSVRKTQSGK